MDFYFVPQMLLEVALALILYALVALSLLVSVCSRANKFISSRTNRTKNALIITAHPDDECMFFGPTIQNLVSSNYDVHLLCCCTGNFYGQGDAREKELEKSANCLGIQSHRVALIKREDLPDNPDITWPHEILRDLILKHCNTIKNLKVVVTFDSRGVSGHANHIAVSKAVVDINQSVKNVHCYTLVSNSIFIKYSGTFIPFGLPFMLISSSIRQRLLLVSGWKGILCIQRAMFQHQSQLLWFRYLFIIFSQYMTVNELQLL